MNCVTDCSLFRHIPQHYLVSVSKCAEIDLTPIMISSFKQVPIFGEILSGRGEKIGETFNKLYRAHRGPR